MENYCLHVTILTETESCYTEIEQDALATTWVCKKFLTYRLGTKFVINTEHKTLVALPGTKL